MGKIFKKFNSLATVSVSITIGSLVIGLGINIAWADWTPPSGNPPEGSIAAPINISSASQYKEGGLMLGGTSGPGSYKLNVQGTAYITENLDMDSGLNIKGNILATGTSGTQSVGSDASPFDALWIKSDLATSGIQFDVASGNAGFKYNNSGGQFEFWRTSAIMTLSDAGDLNVVGNAVIDQGLTVDTNTLVVDATDNQVGIGTADPGESLDVASGNVEITTGNLTVGSSTFTPGTKINVGSLAVPVSGIGLIASSSDNYGVMAYSTGTGAIALSAYAPNGYGAYGKTDSLTYTGIYGETTAVGTTIDEGIAIYGKGAGIVIGGGAGADINNVPTNPGTFSTAVFGKGGQLSGNYTDHFNSFGVYGDSGDINEPPDDKNIYTYGVYGKAGDITNASASSNAHTYGVFGEASTSVDPDGLSYAGWFEGDTVINGNLTIGDPASPFMTIDQAGGKVGIGAASPLVKLHVQANDGEAGVYGIAGDSGAAIPDGPLITVAGVYGGGGNPSSGWNYGVYGKAGPPSSSGTTVAVAGMSDPGGGNTYAGYFYGPVKIINNSSALGTLDVQGEATLRSNVAIAGDLKNYGGLEVINGSTGATCTGAEPSSYDQGTMFICRHCVAVPGALKFELMIRVGDRWFSVVQDDYGSC